MTKNQTGFSAAYVLLAILVVVGVGVVGYSVYQNNHKTTTATVSVQKTTFTGPTAAIDAANSQELSTESSTDSQYSTADQTNATSANQAASSVGGAYNESTY